MYVVAGVISFLLHALVLDFMPFEGHFNVWSKKKKKGHLNDIISLAFVTAFSPFHLSLTHGYSGVAFYAKLSVLPFLILFCMLLLILSDLGKLVHMFIILVLSIE